MPCSDRGPLLHLKCAAEFVDMVLRAEEDRAEFLAQLFIDNPKPVIDAVTREFEDRYVYLHDEDGDGKAAVANVEPGAAAVVSIGENEVDLEFDTEISFSAHVSYGSDTWDHRRADLDRSVTVPVEVTVKYDPSDYLNYEVTKAIVNNGESVSIYTHPDAETHWK